MKIGNIQFGQHPVFLAPMEDVTDRVYRNICKEMGADMVYTEFISSEGLIRDADKSVKKLRFNEYERPVGIQIFGHDIQSMVEAAQYAERFDPDLIDLNFGCPVKKVVRKGGGSGMLRNPDLLIDITKSIINNVNLPVTVKTRLGWDHDSIIIHKLAYRLQDIGVKALTIHARTRSQLYKGKSDWSHIKKLSNDNNIEIPIIGNGDIVNAYDAKKAFDAFNPDAIMIGRAAIGNPWIFKSVKSFINDNEILEDPSLLERINTCKNHLEQNIKIKGERQSILEMRKLYSGYFKGIKHFKPFKINLMNADNYKEIDNIFSNMLENLS